jgi:hypothetical protein
MAGLRENQAQDSHVGPAFCFLSLQHHGGEHKAALFSADDISLTMKTF